MLTKRLLTSAVALPVLFLGIWYGDPWFTAIVAGAVVAGLIEFYGMAGESTTNTLAVFGIAMGVLFVVDARGGSPSTAALMTSVAVFSLVLLIVQRRGVDVAFGWAWTVAGVIYLGWMLSRAVLLRQVDDGRGWIMVAVLGTFAVDTAAFFSGQIWGKYRLAPSISPNKTWEGAIGGFLVGMPVVISLAILFNIPAKSWQVVLLGALVGIFAQLGDLAESALKRSTGVKDAGRLLPGHGGFLDRLDSLIFSVVVVYYFVQWVIK